MSGPTATDRTTTAYRRPTALISSLVLGLALLPAAVGGPGATSRSSASAVSGAAATREAARKATARAYPALPLSFEPNRGQTDPRVRYLARGHGYTLFLTASGAVLNLTHPVAPTCAPGSVLSHAGRTSALANAGRAAQTATHRDLSRSGPCHDLLRSGHGVGPRQSGGEGVLRLTFPGAAAHPAIIPQSQLPGAVSYLHGRDPRHWQTGLPTYARVAYRDVYPGTDLVYYGHAGQLEYDFVLAPGADPRNLRLRLDSGAHGAGAALRLDRSGDLLVSVPGGTLRQRAPVVYQGAGASRRLVAARYALRDAHTVGVRLGAYDHHAPLVVDPALSYSTYLGGSGADYGYGVAVDRSGSAYVVGNTDSTNFPLANAARGAAGGASDAFVAKLNPAGNGLVYSTYLGGGNDDFGLAIAVGSDGAAYVTGQTGSGDFPIANALQGNLNGLGGNAFVAKLNPAGNGLVYSTYLGGGIFDVGQGIAVDSAGAAYVVGYTDSSDFPLASPLQSSFNGSTTAFVSKLNPAGNGLAYSTYLGGSGDNDQANAIAVDSAGAAYVTGQTNSPNFPTTGGAFQRTYQGTVGTAFVSKLNAAGNGLAYSTYLGGSDSAGNGIAVDSAGAAYVTGAANSANFPTAAPLQGVAGGAGDAFVSKLAPDGSALAYSTYLGGSGGDTGYGIAVDSSGDAVVAGQTNSPNFPTTNAAQGALGGADDAFVAALAPAGNGFVYSTYLGGSGSDIARAVTVDAGGNAYVTGQTTSPNLPTVAPFQGSFNGGSYDAFVAKLGNNPIPAAPPAAAPSATPAPPTFTPVPATATATPSATIAPTVTITSSATVTPAATITPTTPLTVPARVVPPPLVAPCSSRFTLPLALSGGSHGVVSSGGLLTFTARTRPATRVTATLQVTAQRAFYVGSGKKRHRVLRTVLVYGTATGGASNSRGLFTGRLRVTYKPASPVRARLNVTGYQICGRATGALTVTIQQRPPVLTTSAPRAVRVDRVLTVVLHTARGAHVTATLQVTVRRTITIGKGKKTVHTTRTVVLYHTAVHGMVDRHGTYTARLHVTYKVKKATGASVITTATLYGVTATRTRGVAILP